MTKTENRAAARAYRAEKECRFREDQDRAGRAADLEAARILRDYLIFKANNRGCAHERLRTAIDDYVEELTGDRTTLHSGTAHLR